MSIVAGEPAAGAAAPAVLDEASSWRMFTCYKTPLVAAKDGGALAESKAEGFISLGTPPPPEKWAAADFDDSPWACYRIPRDRSREADYGFTGYNAFRPCNTLRRNFDHTC